MKFFRMDISVLRGGISAGMITAKQLTAEAFDRIAQLDSGEKGFHAVRALNPDAPFLASRLDERQGAGETTGPLHGIPILLKDNLSTADGLPTAAGAAALADNFCTADAEAVRRLREAGAVILGKTNMTEFANYVSWTMPNGYSSLGGQVGSVFPGIDPSGSSTGSAVAVAMGYCPAAIGTETCGSIIAPAIQAGIVGLKPTLGLCSRRGILPISHTLDTPGPLTRSVRDAALLLEVLAGHDPGDPATRLAQPPSFTAALTEDLSGLRVGISRLFPEEAIPGQTEAASEAAKLLEKQGASCVRLKEETFSCNALFTIMRHEFHGDLECYLRDFGGSRLKTLDGIVRWNEAHAETALRYGQDILLEALAAPQGYAAPEYLAALADREAVIARLTETFEANGVDIILILSGALGHPALAGFPDLTLPLGRNKDGEPLSALLMARPFREDQLLRTGYALEQTLLHQRQARA